MLAALLSFVYKGDSGLNAELQIMHNYGRKWRRTDKSPQQFIMISLPWSLTHMITYEE